MPKKSQKNVKNIFLFKSGTHVSTPIFQGLFKNIVFRSVALVIKKLWAILDFFYTPDFYRPVPYPTHKTKQKNNENSFTVIFLKSQKISR